jgi:hypothetical protein
MRTWRQLNTCFRCIASLQGIIIVASLCFFNQSFQSVTSISHFNQSLQSVISISHFNQSLQSVTLISHFNELLQSVVSISHFIQSFSFLPKQTFLNSNYVKHISYVQLLHYISPEITRNFSPQENLQVQIFSSIFSFTFFLPYFQISPILFLFFQPTSAVPAEKL